MPDTSNLPSGTTMLANLVVLPMGKMGKALTGAILARQPVMIHGDPGMGKSDIVRQTADAIYGAPVNGAIVERDSYYVEIRGSLLDPVDLRGLPTINGDTTVWLRPEFLPTSGQGIIFIDEINRAPVMVQNALFQLILDRRLGDYLLPAGWSIVSAINDNDSGVTKIGSALGNRFLHLYAGIDVPAWLEWATDSGIDAMVRAFIQWRPDLLHVFDRHATAFPTPRTWSYVAGIIGSIDRDILPAMVAGSVGYPAMVEFLAFYDLYAALPSIPAILMNPDTAALPSDPATIYATCAALANRATVDNFGQIMMYVSRMSAEYAVFVIKDSTRRHPELAHTADFTNWAMKNPGVF